MKGEYEDIIDMPHHTSKKHPPMPLIDRAAQFAPFAALVGYDAAIRETARLTDERPELDDYEKDSINGRLQIIAECLEKDPTVSISYFKEDGFKDGGHCVRIDGQVRKIDEYSRAVVMRDGTRIAIDDILDIRGEIFPE